ncbi:fimbrial protein [Paraburkholderia sp. 22099]|jgi:major type 1 subunit fimbrin (pilin)|uniref:fimbrial protein n=1 Tax=Paraburkholderia TaxID=1822464 RepID=UPI0028619101|nr:fimbrial protein [Paraburkholderia terricola]MDR6491716.1 major type 1 subunit fimbrin (pilin) [Paraburkholderia terricola]
MKKTLLSSAFAAAALIALTGPTHAADGQIDFAGSVIASTCVIDAGVTNKTVGLPAVAATTLATAGSSAGRTPFDIQLSACDQDISVAAVFEPGATVNPATGRLIVDAGGATNVEIGLLNNDFGHIQLGAAESAQGSQRVDITDGAATLQYYAQYESLGGATAGPANSRVQYTLSYE